MTKHTDDNTSDISKMTQDALLVKVYRKMDLADKKSTESFHSLDKKTSLIQQKLDSVPTTPEVESMLADHEIRCIEKRKKSDSRHKRPSITPSPKPNRIIYIVGSLIAGAGVVMGWILEKVIP